MKKGLRNILTIVLLACSMSAGAQVTVTQKIDSLSILIGEQTLLHLDVTFPEGSRVEWPNLQERQYITPGVEVVKSLPTDTIAKTGGQVEVDKAYALTSFDERVYAIPALPVKVNGKEYKGSTLALKVITVDVDTLHLNQMYPPKDVQDNPFQWSEWAPAFWLSLIAILLAVVFFYLVIRLKQNKPIITRIRIVRHVPAHKRALDAIEKIKTEHLQASEDQKSYYTQLTDTLRKYIQERFGFNAMEMTSDEIIDNLRRNGDSKMIDELRRLFQTADLVKFAKYSTLLNENDLNLVNAVSFIDQTKQDSQPTEEKIVPKLSDDEKQSRQNRIVIKTLLWVLGVAVLVLMALAVYRIYSLMV